MKSNPKNSGSVISAEFSADIKSHKSYASFVHITEEVYYKFINTIGTPMNVNSKDMHKQRLGMERLTHLNEKKDEYFNAFRKLREFLLESGVSSNELEAMVRKRTEQTSELMTQVYSFVTKHNSFPHNKKLNLVNVNRFIFNIINYINDINAVNYIPPTKEDLKENYNRLTKMEKIQRGLLVVEVEILAGLKLGSKQNISLHDVITGVLGIDEAEIREMLRAYNAEKLWEETE